MLDYEMYKYRENGMNEIGGNGDNKYMQRLNMIDHTLQSNSVNYLDVSNKVMTNNMIALDSSVIARGTLDSGFQNLDSLCGLKGCYRFTTHLNYSTSAQMKEAKIRAASSFFSACGYRG